MVGKISANKSANCGETVVVLGVDVGRGDAPTYYTILNNRTEEVLYHGTDPEQIRKYKIDSVQIDETDLKLWAAA